MVNSASVKLSDLSYSLEDLLKGFKLADNNENFAKPIESKDVKKVAETDSQEVGKQTKLKDKSANSETIKEVVEVSHSGSVYQDMRKLNFPMFLRAIPVPRTTARKGSSAT